MRVLGALLDRPAPQHLSPWVSSTLHNVCKCLGGRVPIPLCAGAPRLHRASQHGTLWDTHTVGTVMLITLGESAFQVILAFSTTEQASQRATMSELGKGTETTAAAAHLGQNIRGNSMELAGTCAR